MGMLVITRYEDEEIMVGDDIRIMLVRGWNGKARIGINAPPDLPVHRKEVYDAIRKEGLDPKEITKEELKEISDLVEKARAKAFADLAERKRRYR